MTITIQELAVALPPNLKGAATQSLADTLNNISGDPEFAKLVRDNYLSYTKVLQTGNFKTEDYLNAVKYVSFKIMGNTNHEAYAKTFPVRYQTLVQKGTSQKDISSYVAAYNKNKLVNLILEQTIVPVHILNMDLKQEAINQLAHLMMNASSDKVKADSANALLTHLATPKETGPLINIDIKQDKGMDALRELLKEVSSAQVEAISSGVPTKTITEQKLVIDNGTV